MGPDGLFTVNQQGGGPLNGKLTNYAGCIVGVVDPIWTLETGRP